MRNSFKQTIGWAFCMIIFPMIPLSTLFIIQPSFLHLIAMLVVIGIIAGFVGRLFE
ncbi:MAG: hypothetical protein O2797_01310 [Bacteroidetes bacterium]|nr:hypothetical protein [Bacteroidota bacterium]